MSDPRCKCPMAISMTGDGCRYCQPQEHIDRTSEWLDEGREEIDRLQAENEALKAEVPALAELVEALEKIAAWPDGGSKYGQKNIKSFASSTLDAHRKQKGRRVMKLIEILARELNEWPKGASLIVQDYDGEVKYQFSEDLPVLRNGNVWVRSISDEPDDAMIGRYRVASDYATAIVTLEMWEAERKRLAGWSGLEQSAGRGDSLHS